MPTSMELMVAKRRWPRVIGIVSKMVDPNFAPRVVLKASRGEEIYLRIVRDAWRQHRVQRWTKGLKR